MVGDDRPLAAYEIKWISEKVERVMASSVTYPGRESSGAGKGHIKFYAVIGGHWTLLFSAQESEIRTIRRLEQDWDWQVRAAGVR